MTAAGMVFSQVRLNPTDTLTCIAFGSCAHQDKPQPIWQAIRAEQPEVFLFLGDNVYGDTHDMDTLRARYQRLGAKPHFDTLRQTTPVLATWDDHDYGTNDCGRNHPEREQSKQVFLDFFHEPAQSQRRTRPGIYDASIVGPVGQRVQIILLDERTFRDEPVAGPHPETDSTGNYIPQLEAQLLGEAQWQWLEQELRKPAEVRIICSSTQFVSEFNGYELWALYPKEKLRMVELLKRTRAAGVVFLSGDLHVGELSRVSYGGLYPLWDATSSGLTQVWGSAVPNNFRVGPSVLQRNYGLVRIDWAAPAGPVLHLQLHSEMGECLVRQSVPLAQLQFGQ
jgi:alkaline phosphatase D